MKINELREGIFDRSTQSNIANFGKVAAKQWNLYKQNLERKNNFQKLSAQQLQGHLRKFVQDNILVKYDIGPKDQQEEAIIAGMMGKILGTDDIDQQSASFATIAQQATKLGIKGAGQEKDSNVMYAQGGKVCKDDTKKVNNIIYVCGKPIKPGEKGYDEIDKMIDGQ